MVEIVLTVNGEERTFTKERFDLFDLLLVSKHFSELEKFEKEMVDKEVSDYEDAVKKLNMDGDFMVMLFGEKFSREEFMTLKSVDYPIIDECKVLALGGESEAEEKKTPN